MAAPPETGRALGCDEGLGEGSLPAGNVALSRGVTIGLTVASEVCASVAAWVRNDARPDVTTAGAGFRARADHVDGVGAGVGAPAVREVRDAGLILEAWTGVDVPVEVSPSAGACSVAAD